MKARVDREEVIRLYQTEGKSASSIADVLGCSTHPVLDILKKEGLTRNRSAARLIGIKEGRIKLPKSAIKKGTVSWNKGKSMSEASKLKLSQSLKQKYATDPLFREKIKQTASNFWAVEINRKAMSNTKKEFYKTHPEFHPRLGKKHSQDSRKKISETEKRRFIENPELRAELSQRLKQLYAETKIVPWHKIYWSDSEVSSLKDNNNKLSDEEFSKKFGKSISTINRKRYELGLQKKAFTWWSEDQANFLKNNYANKSNEELSKLLKKTLGAISAKAYELNLKKSKEYRNAYAARARASIGVVWNKGKKLGFVPKAAFKRGTTPWNKGKKTGMRQKSVFVKGQSPWNKGKTGVYSEEVLKKMGAGTKKLWDKPGFREMRIAANKKQWTDENYRKRMGAKSKKLWLNQNFRDKIIAAIKEKWKDPQFRKNLLSNVGRAAWKGSKPEKRAYDYLSIILGKENVKFKDWDILSNREVDISIPNLRVAIEYDGITHFSPIHGEKALLKRQQQDRQKKEDLEKLGWRFFRIYDEDGISYHEMEEQCNAIIRSLPGFEDFIPPQKRLTQ